MKTLVTLSVISLSLISAFAETAIILDQPDSEVKISGYTNKYQKDQVGDGASIFNDLEVKNSSTKEVAAIQVGFVYLDAFNDLIEVRIANGYGAIKPSEIDQVSWEQSATRIAQFKDLGTGMCYVRAVRFSDGTIWRASEGPILEKLREKGAMIGSEKDLMEVSQK